MHYNLIVIGSGDAGAPVAFEARKKGWSVVIIDKNPFGGTCALRGCVPKKVLVTGAEVVDFMRRMDGRGITAPNPTLDWRELMAYKTSFTQNTTASLRKSFKKYGIDAYDGEASFVNEKTIKVDDHIFTSDHIHIATGSIARPLGVDGEEFIRTSSEFLSLESLPSSIIFIGGGFISMEFAGIAARAGSQVTIIHRSKRVLKGFDPDLVSLLVEGMQAFGIRIITDQAVACTGAGNGKMTVKTDKASYSADMAFHGAGRIPDTLGLNADKGNVAYDKRGIIVDAYLTSTTNPHVTAAGDVASSGPLLTPIAMYEGHLVAHNLLNNAKIEHMDYQNIPSVAYTLPPIARVGMQEREARKKGFDFDVFYREDADWFHNSRVNEKWAGHKVLVEKKTGIILGAHILGEKAEEVINIFALAMQQGLTAEHMKNTIFAYPTAGSSIKYMFE